MANPQPPFGDPDAERTEVLDLRDIVPPAPAPVRPAPPAAPEPDIARVDHRGTVEWQLQEARWSNRPSTDVGLRVLRLCSLPLVLRGLHKVVDHAGFVDTLRGNEFAAQSPELIGVLVTAAEIGLPVLIAIGLATRVAGLAQASLMVGIFVVWTLAGGTLLDPATGALAGEPELLFAGLALPLLFTGPGRFSVDRALTASGREQRIQRRVARRLGE